MNNEQLRSHCELVIRGEATFAVDPRIIIALLDEIETLKYPLGKRASGDDVHYKKRSTEHSYEVYSVCGLHLESHDPSGRGGGPPFVYGRNTENVNAVTCNDCLDWLVQKGESEGKRMNR